MTQVVISIKKQCNIVYLYELTKCISVKVDLWLVWSFDLKSTFCQCMEDHEFKRASKQNKFSDPTAKK